MRELEFGSLASAQEEETLRDTLIECFNFPASRWPNYFRILGGPNFRVVRDSGRVIGGLGVYRIGQWFGGRSIPMGAIAAVGVAPAERFGGAARTLMGRTLLELHADGFPLSALYASTQHLYRAVGYEQAGSRCEYQIPVSLVSVRDRDLPMQQVDPMDLAGFRETYNLRARRSNGMLDRSDAMWERMVTVGEGETIRAYLIGAGDQPEGYLAFTQVDRPSGYELHLRDWTATSPAAMRRFLTFLSDHRSLAREIHWFGPPIDPIFCLFEEQHCQAPRTHERWMLRIVDLPKALEQRGYRDDLEIELHMEATDDLIPSNNGRFILRVSGGRGAVLPGGRGDLKTDIRRLAPLYSALLSAEELAGIGWITATEEGILAANRIFAGPAPWMPDGF